MSSESEETTPGPGTWTTSDELPESDDAELAPIRPERHPPLVAAYSLFREEFKPKADVIYHPCSANDVSPSVAFPDSRVIYVDISEVNMKALKDAGYETHVASALEFNPGQVDMLIIQNPQIAADIPASYVEKDGFVLTNNYHGTAAQLLNQDSSYKLEGVIMQDYHGTPTLEKENLDGFLVEIDTEEEFRRIPPGFGSMDYGGAEDLVQAITGKTTDISSEYKNIIVLAREQSRQRGESDLKDPIKYLYDGKEFYIFTMLPIKKGGEDDTYIFKKLN